MACAADIPRRNPFTAPKVAWPSLAVFVVAAILWVAALSAGVLGFAPRGIAIVAGAVAVYAMFTPLHEAMHGSLARSSALNAVIGRVGASLFFAPFPAARYFHLEHHQHTNDPQQDPDAWSGRGPVCALPLRWATQDLHYYVRIFRAPGMSHAELAETIVTFALFLSACVGLIAAGRGDVLLLHWVLPSRIAIFVLAYAFDYLPHRPHEITAHENRYAATSVRPGWVGTWLMLGQGYHLVHHLYPGVPFYRYRAIWAERGQQLVARGGRVR